jgi:hypothetical protein
MGATAAIAIVGAITTAYTVENQKGAKRDAEWQAEKAEKRQQAQIAEVEEKKKVVDQQKAMAMTRQANRAQKDNGTLLTSSLGSSGGGGSNKTLLGY